MCRPVSENSVVNTDSLETLADSGFCWLRGALNPSEVFHLGEICERREASEHSGAGIRLPLSDFREFWGVLNHNAIRNALDAALNCRVTEFKPVRAILFDKSNEARWFVGWHRDTMIPVKAHRPSRILTAPSIKDGIPHVRASVEILSRMFAMRIHLDPMHESNGPLRVIPGSHQCSDADSSIDEITQAEKQRMKTLAAQPGDILLMRPLLLHSSLKPKSDDRRRVLHIEFAGPQSLPDEFEWNDL